MDGPNLFLRRPAEPFVFADPTGRRARVVRVALVGLAGCFALWLVALVVGAVGFNAFPSPLRHPVLARRSMVGTPFRPPHTVSVNLRVRAPRPRTS